MQKRHLIGLMWSSVLGYIFNRLGYKYEMPSLSNDIHLHIKRHRIPKKLQSQPVIFKLLANRMLVYASKQTDNNVFPLIHFIFCLEYSYISLV